MSTSTLIGLISLLLITFEFTWFIYV
jgi:hypothetical protein